MRHAPAGGGPVGRIRLARFDRAAFDQLGRGLQLPGQLQQQAAAVFDHFEKIGDSSRLVSDFGTHDTLQNGFTGPRGFGQRDFALVLGHHVKSQCLQQLR